MKRSVKAVFMIYCLSAVGLCQAQSISDFVSKQVANQVSRTTSSNIAKNLADRLIIPQLKIRNESGKVKDLHVSADSELIGLLHDDGSVRVWDTRLGKQRPGIRPQGPAFTKLIVVSKNGTVLAAEKNGDIAVYDVMTAKFKRRLASKGEAVSAMTVSEDESILAVAYEDGSVIMWSILEFKQIKSIKTPYDDEIDFVLIEKQGKSLLIAGEDGFVDRWDVAAATKTASLADDIDDVTGVWRNPVNDSVMFIDEDGVLQKFENSNMKIAEDFADDILSFTVDQSLSMAALSTEAKDLKLFAVNGMKLIKSVKVEQELYHLKFVNNGKQLLAADERGILFLFDIATGREILKLISTESGWTIVDNNGRFDSAEESMENVSWEAEKDEIPLDNFSETHYEPGLLANHLENEVFINKTPRVIQQGIKLPPEVKLIIPDGQKTALQPITISVEIQGMGGGVADVSFYHNGKVLGNDALINSREEINDKLVKKTLDFNLVPTAGTNQFKVIAANKMGIEGHSGKINVDFIGENPKSTLHILTIGVNKYQDPRLNLDYSVADAESVASILGNLDFLEYEKIQQHKLRNQGATKKAIIEQLTDIAQSSQQDVLAIYLAGHGLAVDGEWYFLPHETMLQENLEYFTQVGVSATEIKRILTQTKAQRIFIMVDACYSGAGLHAFRKLQDTQRHFSRSLSKSVGLVIMAATRKDQEAAELSDLGHGLFTYVVSEGMNGQADLKPKNQRISAHEVADFSVKVIPEFSKKYLGAAQEPTAFKMGNDFTLLNEEK